MTNSLLLFRFTPLYSSTRVYWILILSCANLNADVDFTVKK